MVNITEMKTTTHHDKHTKQDQLWPLATISCEIHSNDIEKLNNVLLHFSIRLLLRILDSYQYGLYIIKSIQV